LILAAELHLPDLPEVSLSLGPAPAARRPAVLPWPLRLRDAVSSYLPLLLMLLLALATWWLVKNSPKAPGAATLTAARVDPDYTMSGFALERFDAQGRLKLRLEGAQMRHFPVTDRIEIDGVKVRAIAPDGRVTLAHAQRALSNGDGSEVQLLGGAEVTSNDAHGAPLVMRSEFLHAFFVTERVTTNAPVWVQFGATQLRAASLDYDHAARRLDLGGPMRMSVPGSPPRQPVKVAR
jgi:lipopolysaccharide export system protein LptC